MHLPFCIGDQGGSAVIGIEGLEHTQTRVAGIAQGGAQEQACDQNHQDGEVNVMRHDISPVPLPLTRAPGGYQGARPSGEYLMACALDSSGIHLSRNYLMNGIQALLDKAKLQAGGISDAELARRIDVTPQTLSQWRRGDVPMPDTRIPQIAHIANDAPEYWLVYLQGEKAKTPKLRAHWLNVFKALEMVTTQSKTVPAIALLVLAANLMPSAAKASEINSLHVPTAHSLYIM